MIITHDQQTLLAGFHCRRIKEVPIGLVHSIKGKVIEGEESNLASLFKSKKTYEEDLADVLASYVIVTSNDEPLGFFSLRCGELYKRVDLNKMELAHKAWNAMKRMRSTSLLSAAEREECINAIRDAFKAGITTPDEMQLFATKSANYERDKKMWSGHNIEQVSQVFPAVELNLFGVNELALPLWSSYELPQRFGESIFWQVVVGQIETVCNVVGCQYVYLFAADKDPDGELVNYYTTRLHFKSELDLNANKPNFDFNCRFMYQEVATLKKYKQYFFDHFNAVSR